jgi:hypothetical protein
MVGADMVPWLTGGFHSMRALTFLAGISWLIGSCFAWAQGPPVDPQVVFPNSDGAMARALADPKLPPEVKVQLFALFDARLGPQLIEDDAGNIWLYRRGQPPVIVKTRKP